MIDGLASKAPSLLAPPSGGTDHFRGRTISAPPLLTAPLSGVDTNHVRRRVVSSGRIPPPSMIPTSSPCPPLLPSPNSTAPSVITGGTRCSRSSSSEQLDTVRGLASMSKELSDIHDRLTRAEKSVAAASMKLKSALQEFAQRFGAMNNSSQMHLEQVQDQGDEDDESDKPSHFQMDVDGEDTPQLPPPPPPPPPTSAPMLPSLQPSPLPPSISTDNDHLGDTSTLDTFTLGGGPIPPPPSPPVS